MSARKEVRFRGAPVSEGIAMGGPFLLSHLSDGHVPDVAIADRDIEHEIARYRQAIFFSQQDLQHLHNRLAREGTRDVAAIIETHIRMLDDPLMTVHIEERIRDMRKNTEVVFLTAMKEYERRFSETQDHFFQQRLVDIRDLSKRILGHLCHKPHDPFAEVPSQSVIFAKELLPSHIAGISDVSGFITQAGGGHSHAALIARARGIPYVANVDLKLFDHIHMQYVIIDGMTGDIIINPSSFTIQHYCQVKLNMTLQYQQWEKEANLPSETRDGYTVRIYANIGNMLDLQQAHERGAIGVGLFRSEHLFLHKAKSFPSEDEQCEAYAALFAGMKGLPFVIRVFDIGGDKTLSPTIESSSSFYHSTFNRRGIRFLLEHRDMFKKQLRAIARASSSQTDVRILLPLISDLSELQASKILLEQVQKELGHFHPFPIGCMVEVPSAVFICEALAKESQFLSIGTNDLVQYTLGVDRSDPLMSQPQYLAHPSILRMLNMAVLAANQHQIPIGICGEMASNPLLIPLFLGLGIREFSCAPRYIPMIKHAIRSASFKESSSLVRDILQQDHSQDIFHMLTHHASL